MPRITIYTAQNCPFSKRLRNFLYEEGIPFEEIPIDKRLIQTEQFRNLDKDIKTPIINLKKDGITKATIIGWNEIAKKSVIHWIDQ